MVLDPSPVVTHVFFSSKEDSDAPLGNNHPAREGVRIKSKNLARHSLPAYRRNRRDDVYELPLSPVVKAPTTLPDSTVSTSKTTPEVRAENKIKNATLARSDSAKLHQSPSVKRPLASTESEGSNIPFKKAVEGNENIVDDTKPLILESPPKHHIIAAARPKTFDGVGWSDKENKAILLPSPTIKIVTPPSNGGGKASDRYTIDSDLMYKKESDSRSKERSPTSYEISVKRFEPMDEVFSPLEDTVTLLSSPTTIRAPPPIKRHQENAGLFVVAEEPPKLELPQDGKLAERSTVELVSMLLPSPSVERAPPLSDHDEISTKESMPFVPEMIVGGRNDNDDWSDGEDKKMKQLLETDIDELFALQEPTDSGYFDNKRSLEQAQPMDIEADPAAMDFREPREQAYTQATLKSSSSERQSERTPRTYSIQLEEGGVILNTPLDIGGESVEKKGESAQSPTTDHESESGYFEPKGQQVGTENETKDEDEDTEAEDNEISQDEGKESECESDDYEVVEVRATDIYTPTKVFTEEFVVRRRRRKSGKFQWSLQINKRSSNGYVHGTVTTSSDVNPLDQTNGQTTSSDSPPSNSVDPVSPTSDTNDSANPGVLVSLSTDLSATSSTHPSPVSSTDPPSTTSSTSGDERSPSSRRSPFPSNATYLHTHSGLSPLGNDSPALQDTPTAQKDEAISASAERVMPGSKISTATLEVDESVTKTIAQKTTDAPSPAQTEETPLSHAGGTTQHSPAAIRGVSQSTKHAPPSLRLSENEASTTPPSRPLPTAAKNTSSSDLPPTVKEEFLSARASPLVEGSHNPKSPSKHETSVEGDASRAAHDKTPASLQATPFASVFPEVSSPTDYVSMLPNVKSPPSVRTSSFFSFKEEPTTASSGTPTAKVPTPGTKGVGSPVKSSRKTAKPSPTREKTSSPMNDAASVKPSTPSALKKGASPQKYTSSTETGTSCTEQGPSSQPDNTPSTTEHSADRADPRTDSSVASKDKLPSNKLTPLSTNGSLPREKASAPANATEMSNEIISTTSILNKSPLDDNPSVSTSSFVEGELSLTMDMMSAAEATSSTSKEPSPTLSTPTSGTFFSPDQNEGDESKTTAGAADNTDTESEVDVLESRTLSSWRVVIGPFHTATQSIQGQWDRLRQGPASRSWWLILLAAVIVPLALEYQSRQ